MFKVLLTQTTCFDANFSLYLQRKSIIGSCDFVPLCDGLFKLLHDVRIYTASDKYLSALVTIGWVFFRKPNNLLCISEKSTAQMKDEGQASWSAESNSYYRTKRSLIGANLLWANRSLYWVFM